MTVLGLVLQTSRWQWAIWRDAAPVSSGESPMRVGDLQHSWQMQRFLLAWDFQDWLLRMVDAEDVDLVSVAPVKETNPNHMALLGALTCVGAVYQVPLVCPTQGELERAGVKARKRGNCRPTDAQLAATLARLGAIPARLAPPDLLS